MPLLFNPHFPLNALPLMRGAIAYLDTPRFDACMNAIVEAAWQQQNLDKPQVLAGVLEAAGFDSAEFARLNDEDSVKQRLKADTEEPVERDVFGAPSIFVDEQQRIVWTSLPKRWRASDPPSARAVAARRRQ
ncbi:DsbA family protein [Pseudomonas sp. MBLB4136]|uniref:DsbA family protein n=1 Tax=Pseudomonas sp. MBLB4136 TaxID=3451558 RepID=UPI003F74B869